MHAKSGRIPEKKIVSFPVQDLLLLSENVMCSFIAGFYEAQVLVKDANYSFAKQG